jgi:ATP-dependent DNA helicase RecG
VPICLCGEVVNTQLRRFGGWKKIFEATLQEPGGNALSQPLVCRWFNLHYVQKMIATGQRLVVFGKPRLRGKRLCMEHPEFEVIETDDEISIHFRRITPIYPATEGVSQRLLRSIIYRLLNELSDEPVETRAPARLVTGDRRHALQMIHFPENWEKLRSAREHLVLSEFFGLQMRIASRRARSRWAVSERVPGSGKLQKRFWTPCPLN